MWEDSISNYLQRSEKEIVMWPSILFWFENEWLSSVDLDEYDLELLDDDERAEALEDAGLDADDFDF